LKRGQKKSDQIIPTKPELTPIQKIEKMLSYKTGDEESYQEDPPDTIPVLRFIPARREVIQRLIVKACAAKKAEDFLISA